MDKYEEVTLKIVDAINSSYGDSHGDSGDGGAKFDVESIKKIINKILQNNFNIKDEEIGKVLMKEVGVFDPESGNEFYTPIFTAPTFASFGVLVISPEIFPNYGIDNKYIGYTEKGIFYRINDFTIFMRRARKRPMLVISIFILIYLGIILLMFATK